MKQHLTPKRIVIGAIVLTLLVDQFVANLFTLTVALEAGL